MLTLRSEEALAVLPTQVVFQRQGFLSRVRVVRPVKPPPYTTWARRDGHLGSAVFRKHLILDRNAVNSSRRLDSPSPKGYGKGFVIHSV